MSVLLTTPLSQSATSIPHLNLIQVKLVSQWMENFINKNMIMFVCSRSLCEAWSDSENEQDPFVSTSRQLLQGHLSSGESVSKLPLLFYEKDSQYIPSLYLKNIPAFVLLI